MAPKITVFNKHIRKPVTSTVSNTRKDVPRLKSLVFKAEQSSINMLHCETGEEAKSTIHIQKNERLPRKMIKENPYGQ